MSQVETRCSQLPARADITAQARTWIGTPWKHQGRLKGISCDCAGLIIGVARELGIGDHNEPYHRQPDVLRMRKTLAQQLIEISVDDVREADILYLSFAGQPTHLAFVAPGNRIIHAYEPLGRVVEHIIDAKWRRRIVGAYRIPGVE